MFVVDLLMHVYVDHWIDEMVIKILFGSVGRK